MKEHDKLETAAQFNDSIEANAARALLEEKGIEAVVFGEGLPYAGVISGASAIELKVFSKDLSRAKHVLDKHEKDG